MQAARHAMVDTDRRVNVFMTVVLDQKTWKASLGLIALLVRLSVGKFRHILCQINQNYGYLRS